MNAEQFRSAAKAISDYRWILAAALSSTNIEHSKPSQKVMGDLSKLVDALLAEAKEQSEAQP